MLFNKLVPQGRRGDRIQRLEEVLFVLFTTAESGLVAPMRVLMQGDNKSTLLAAPEVRGLKRGENNGTRGRTW